MQCIKCGGDMQPVPNGNGVLWICTTPGCDGTRDS